MTPRLSPRQEESFCAGHTVDHGRLVAVQRQQVSLPGDAQSTEVADVFADRQFTVDRVSRESTRFKCVVLVDQRFGAFGEALAVNVAPPIRQASVPVEFTSLVIETMAEFVPDDGTDCAVVRGGVALGDEKRVLKNGRGEDYLVEAGVVIGVHRLRQHEPFVAVKRFSDLAGFPRKVEPRNCEHVSDEVIDVHVNRRIVPPTNRVANLGGELVELFESTRLCLVAHPFEIRDRLAIRLDQILDQEVHLGFCGGRKVSLNVEFPNRFTKATFDKPDAALPAVAQLGSARQCRSVERKVLVDEIRRQVRRKPVDDLPAQPVSQ